MKLGELVSIDRRFQNSINLQLDLNKKDKVSGYIPTRSSVTILKRYLDNILEDRLEKSTLLVGPYGKGKSHLLLLLDAILSYGNFDNKDEVIESLCKKIATVDESTAASIVEVRKRGRFLPVMISGSTDSLNQAFLTALNDALKRDGLDDITPDTYYTAAIEVIDNWRDNYVNTYNEYLQLVGDADEFYRDLLNCDLDTLNRFKEIYPALTAGSVFNPLINTDLINIYMSTSEALSSQYGYAGIIIIFDEFSKFIEGHDKSSMSADMKIIQDMCELCNSSKQNRQIHFIMVVHKGIKEYGNVLDIETINAFTGVEGRLNEVLFISSAANNYEIIRDAIVKSDRFNEFISKTDYFEECKKYHKLSMFNSVFTEEQFCEIVLKGCFPLNPIALAILLSVSEKAAQNERTLFTFISNDEKYTLARYVKEHTEGENYIVDASYIYDYFSGLFKRDVSNVCFHNEWLKAEYAITKYKDKDVIKIIKVIALINMLSREDDLRATEKMVQYASGLDRDDYVRAVDILLKDQIIVMRHRTMSYMFRNNVGIDIEKEIANVKATKYKNINLCECVTDVSEMMYELPKSYNQKYALTRYFEYMYMDESQFLAVADASYIFDNSYADGKIVAIIDENEVDSDRVARHIEKLNDARIVVVIAKRPFAIRDTLTQLLSVRYLKQDDTFIEENKVLLEELNLYEEDLIYEINEYLIENYEPSNGTDIVSLEGTKTFTKKREFNRFLGDVCDKYYSYTPKINNELINKRSISAQIKKARKIVVDALLNHNEVEEYYTSTSAQATIFRASLVRTGVIGKQCDIDTGVKMMLLEIDKFIQSCEEKKRSFEELYAVLEGKNYGIRRGVIPIYIAYTISRLHDIPVVYIKNSEIEISSDILNNINDAPQDYELYVERGTTVKRAYIDKMYDIFSKYDRGNVRSDSMLTKITSCISKWYKSLPRCSVVCSIDADDDFNRKVDTFRKIFKSVEINSREVLFDRLPVMYEGDYMACAAGIEQIKDRMDRLYNDLIIKIINTTNNIFNADATSNLKNVLTDWYNSQSAVSKEYLLSSDVNQFMNMLNTIDTYDQEEIASMLAKNILFVHVEDFNDSSITKYEEQLIKIKTEIENIKDNGNSYGDKRQKLSLVTDKGDEIVKYFEDESDDDVSYFFKNAIEEAIEEFGDTLEVNQKVSVLVNTLLELMKDGEMNK